MQGRGGRGGDSVNGKTRARDRREIFSLFFFSSFFFFLGTKPLLTNLATPPRYFSPRNYFPLLRISKLVYTLYIDRLTTTLKRISSPPLLYARIIAIINISRAGGRGCSVSEGGYAPL